MDDRIDAVEAACRYYDTQLAAHGPDAVETMTAVCYLAHALAVLGQFDRQTDDAWRLINDAAEGLAAVLGPADPFTQLADRIHNWIGDIGSPPPPPGGRRQ